MQAPFCTDYIRTVIHTDCISYADYLCKIQSESEKHLAIVFQNIEKIGHIIFIDIFLKYFCELIFLSLIMNEKAKRQMQHKFYFEIFWMHPCDPSLTSFLAHLIS